jgi:predicted flap endonuclease-1-like 5' DNA nuclease
MVVWILGFFSIFAAANLVNATIMWFENGPWADATLYLLGADFAIPVYVYMLIAIFSTLAFLGATTHMLVSELSVSDQIKTVNEKANRLQTGQESQQKMLESVQARVFLVDEGLERARKELLKGLADQNDAVKLSLDANQQAQQKAIDAVQGRIFLLDESMKVMEKELSALAKQKGDISEIRDKLDRLEALVAPEPLLTSKSNVEDIKGIGPVIGAELREVGIASVGDLIMADPKTIIRKTGSSENTVDKWQGRAQLSLVPGLKDKDMLLLEELDINDRKDLAKQDTILLSKKLNAIFKVNLAKGKVSEADKPTIEEIDSWIKFVKP